MPEIESIMEKICDNCHWPYAETDQDALDSRCECCTIEAEIRKLKEGAVATITTVFCEAIKATQENIPAIVERNWR